MEFIKPVKKPATEENKKLEEKYREFNALVVELGKKEVPDELAKLVNSHIEQLNNFQGPDKDQLKQLRKTQSAILKLIEKELKLVTKNHYLNLWTALGMSAFGLPVGVAIGLSVGNIALLAIGLPIGMAIGMAVGTGLDKKAFESGKQLSVEIKF